MVMAGSGRAGSTLFFLFYASVEKKTKSLVIQIRVTEKIRIRLFKENIDRERAPHCSHQYIATTDFQIA